MSDSENHDSSHKWLIFFFVCFAMTVFGIGVWACFCYNPNEAPSEGAGGGHSMIRQFDMPFDQPFVTASF
ncbi:MAG: hypothetical protein K8F91_15090 [Candidatus Obscuribacterales bacterium]|nr:hypothetical protein [Candidatus Obscuribacterales bacterium]